MGQNTDERYLFLHQQMPKHPKDLKIQYLINYYVLILFKTMNIIQAFLNFFGLFKKNVSWSVNLITLN